MTVAGYYNDTFTNANSNIYVQYGNTDLGGSEYYFNFVTYNQYVSAYNSIPSKSPIQISANSSLSTYDASPYGSDYVWIQPGIARALGITSEVQGACIGCNLPATGITPSGSNCTAGTAGCYDGIITITNNGGITLYYDDLGGSEPSGAYDFYAVVEHETDEVLGTSSCITTETSPLSNACNTDGSAGSGAPSAVDLFRYSAAGSLILDSSLSTASGAYFSYNGGSTNGANGSAGSAKFYNTGDNGADYADFALVSPCGPNQSIQDAYGCPGADGGLTILNDGGAEVNILTAVGYQVPPTSVNFGSANVCTSGSNPSPCSQSATVTLSFSASATGISPSVVSQGASGLDFTDAGGGTCDTNGTGHSYTAGNTCTVNVTFKPKYPGVRYGAVSLLNGSSSVVASIFIYGTGSGPQLAFGPQPTTTLSLGRQFTGPNSVAVDGSGNVYVGDGSISLIEMPPGCISPSCESTRGGGFNGIEGVAVDGSGNLYVADSGNNAVKKLSSTCTSSACVTTLGGGFNDPYGVAVDANGNVYVADYGNNAVKEFAQSCTSSSCVTTLGGGFNNPAGIAVDGSGDIYVGDQANNGVKKMPSGCSSSSCVTTLGGGFSHPWGVAVDAGGNVYVADYGNTALAMMSAGCASSSCVTTVRHNVSDRFSGVTLDGSGNVYASALGSVTVYELGRANPPSLSFASTGVGSQSSDSPQTVMLRNIGNAALSFPVPGTGENPSVSANFTLDGSTTCPEVLSSGSAGTLAPGASCELAVDFIPQTSGQVTGSAVLTDTNLNAIPSTTQSIGLSGTGGTPTPIVPYIQVNGGAWQQTASVSVNVGDTVNLGPQPQSGGSWSWTGPSYTASTRVIDSVPLNSPSNVYTATYTNSSGATSTQAFTITVNSTPIVPYLQVNGGAWQQISTVAVNLGDTVNLGPQPQSGGSWSWTGPSYTATTRVINSIPLNSPSNVYTATYTNASGVTSTKAFTITVNATPITPYLQVNGGPWQQTASVTVSSGATVNLGPQPLNGGTWNWTGPNGFTSTSRVLNGIALTTGSNVYSATYTNADGVNSTQTFTITSN
jgi:sugar lactone lactonase YvrE